MRIAIASGKGGAGKTMLATNLAHYLSRQRPVTLLDCDVEEPNSALFFPGEYYDVRRVTRKYPEWNSDACTRCGLCGEVCAFHAVLPVAGEVVVFERLCHGCHACSELCPTQALPMAARGTGTIRQAQFNDLRVIEGRMDVGEEQAVPVIDAALGEAKAELVIIDAPPGTACTAQKVIETSDVTVLVTEPTPFGFHDLTLAVALVQKYGREPLVVLNRDGDPYGPLAQFLTGFEIVRIPDDRTLATLYADGRLAWEHVPALENALKNLAQRIFHEKT